MAPGCESMKIYHDKWEACVPNPCTIYTFTQWLGLCIAGFVPITCFELEGDSVGLECCFFQCSMMMFPKQKSPETHGGRLGRPTLLRSYAGEVFPGDIFCSDASWSCEPTYLHIFCSRLGGVEEREATQLAW